MPVAALIAVLGLAVPPMYLAVLSLIASLIVKRERNELLLSSLLLTLTYLGLSTPLMLASLFTTLGHRFRRGTIFNLFMFSAISYAYIHAYLYLHGVSWSEGYIALLSITAGITAALVECVRPSEFLLILSASTVLTVMHIYSIRVPLYQIAMAFVISFLLSVFATRSGVADDSGLLSATLIGTLIIAFSDIRYFITLLLFYSIGSAVTKYKYSVKLKRGIAEQAGGARGYENVFSNSLPGLFFVMNHGVTGCEAFSAAFVASIATALGDTMASEVGKTAEKVYLITNFKRVEPGVSGGVSLIGEVAALIGCAIVSASAAAMGIINVWEALLAFLAGLIGVHVDSILGATLEERGYITNAGVNFLATLSSGILCYLLLLR